MRYALPVLMVCCLLTAGCITDGTGVSSTATTTPSETTTTSPPATPTPTVEPTPRPEPTPAVELTSTGIECNDSLFVDFYGISEDTLWTQDSVRVGYYLPPNTSIMFVTYIDGTVQGVSTRNNTHDDGIHSDGDKLSLKTRFSGSHVVRTVIYQDTNGDGQFEKGTDAPCLVNGEIAQAGPTRVNFSRFD